MATTAYTLTVRSLIYVTAHIPPTISISGTDEPFIEIRMKLEYPESIILHFPYSRLHPLFENTALTLNNANSQTQYVPEIESEIGYEMSYRYVHPPPLYTDLEHPCVSLKPGKTTIVKIAFRRYAKLAFRRYGEPFHLDRAISPPEEQFLKIGEEYEIGYHQEIVDAGDEEYKVGDFRQKPAEWDETPYWRDGPAKVVVGERCRFRVEA